jgi:predicted lipoprotein with Yx(FWY)xxD motif
MRPLKLFISLGAALVVAAVGAGLALAGRSGGGAHVKLAKTDVGTILVDSKGITLYDFVKDKGTTSACYGACAALWPPLLTTGKPVAGPGVRASLLGTTKRNQFGGPWWVLSAAGKEIHRG